MSLSIAFERQTTPGDVSIPEYALAFDEAVPSAYLEARLGKPGFVAPSEEAAQAWIQSPRKRSFDRALRLVATWMGANVVTGWLMNRVEAFDGECGQFLMKGGFPGVPLELVKVRTFKMGADEMIRSPFEHKGFRKELCTRDDRLLGLWWVAWARRLGLDELRQLTDGVKKRQVTAVGPRMYSKEELAGIAPMHKVLADNYTDPRGQLLRDYWQKVIALQPKSGIFSPSMVVPVDLGMLSRMWTDLWYWRRATPWMDLEVFLGALRTRLLEGVGANQVSLKPDLNNEQEAQIQLER